MKLENIMDTLKKGVADVYESEHYINYLKVMSRFYNYSANNCLLILMQCPEATLVAGYKAWQEKFKRQVKKGEKSIQIIAPCPHRKIKEVDGQEQEVVFTTFRTTSVFDISQTEGEELPTICNELTGDVDGYIDLIDRIVTACPVPVKYEDIKGGALGYYSNADKVIVIKAGMSEEQTLKTLIHELSHALLHDKENGAESKADSRTKEVQAESVAYTVCSALGVDTSSYSFEYIAGWSYNKEVKELMNSLETIRKTAKYILERIGGNNEAERVA